MSSLPTALRKQLEKTIFQARKIAESGARKALESLAVHEPDPYPHMDEGLCLLRRKLRAQGRQLGDVESRTRPGAYELKHLAEKLAYDQWHRILFARFLLENDLLIHPEHEVAVTLADCEELAPALGLRDAWAVAAQFASRELPEIFRADDPTGAVELSVEDRKPLINLVIGLPSDTFTASDSLGWCYQFWQAERKDEVNASGSKIGADELPAVTQLFTEDYMVDFLLDNTLGAWHAGKVFATNPTLVETAQSEEELRDAVALPGCTWSYLRFLRAEDGKWAPAAGSFHSWPKVAKQLKCLDPCMGSGHFVVAMFNRLVALRIAEEELDDLVAVAAVIRDNFFGLEIDPRCTQIGAFNVALAAWRRAGHCKLPAMHLACSGLAPNARREDWLKLAAETPKLRFAMGALYDLFQSAPVLGSLVDPRRDKAVNYSTRLEDLRPLLERALSPKDRDDRAHEMAVTARGLAKAAEILIEQFTLVATNVPYLGAKKQDNGLKDYCERTYPSAKADLATCFVKRSLNFLCAGGTAALVTPQNWLFLGSYKPLREDLLKNCTWNAVAKLGPRAFETIGGEVVNVSLTIHTRTVPYITHSMCGADANNGAGPAEKARIVGAGMLLPLPQYQQLKNPDCRIVFRSGPELPLLSRFAISMRGIVMGDGEMWSRFFWEVGRIENRWRFLQSTVVSTMHYGGREQIIDWSTSGDGMLRPGTENEA